jgi:hypothetical protein
VKNSPATTKQETATDGLLHVLALFPLIFTFLLLLSHEHVRTMSSSSFTTLSHLMLISNFLFQFSSHDMVTYAERYPLNSGTKGRQAGKSVIFEYEMSCGYVPYEIIHSSSRLSLLSQGKRPERRQDRRKRHETGENDEAAAADSPLL